MERVFKSLKFGILNIIELLSAVVGAVIGTLEGFFKCIFSYFKGLKYVFHREFSLKAKSELAEPAKEKYFFYKQYEDLKNAYQSASSINFGNKMVSKQKLIKDDMFTVSRVNANIIFITMLGNVFNTIFFLVHFLIITIITMPIYILYCLVMISEKIKFKKDKILGVCPYCHARFNLPYYICPKCGKVHKNLIPSAYGIVKRICECGEVLPSTHFGGRAKLQSICPVCSETIELREASPICIPIVGGESVGKTSFMYSTINTLINDISKERKWNIRFLNIKDEERFNDFSAKFNKGIPPSKTLKIDPTVFNVFINSQEFSSEKLLYIYDIAGEFFNERSTIRRQKYYEYIKGLVIVLDPLTLEHIAKNLQCKDDLKNNNISGANVCDLLDRIILSLREICKVPADEFINIPVAIVVNKMDAVDYEGSIEELLKSAGEENIIRKIDYNFVNYKFFGSSALGNAQQGKPYKSQGISEPVKWILSQADRELK